MIKSWRQIRQQGKAATDALLSKLAIDGIYHKAEVDSDGRLKRLFIAPLGNIKIAQMNYDVLILNNTYKTNKFNMPLLNAVGMYYTN